MLLQFIGSYRYTCFLFNVKELARGMSIGSHRYTCFFLEIKELPYGM